MFLWGLLFETSLEAYHLSFFNKNFVIWHLDDKSYNMGILVEGKFFSFFFIVALPSLYHSLL